MLERIRDNFHLSKWRDGSHRRRPVRRAETIEEAERLREAERRIASTTGWDCSTMVIGRLLERLRSERDEP